MKCFECDKTVQVKKYRSYIYDGVGLDNICLLNLEVEFCASCKTETPILRNVGRLHRAIGVAIALQPSQLSGKDVRFLRRASGFSVGDWAKRLNVADATYSRWENSKQSISANPDRMARINYLTALKHKDPDNIQLAKYMYKLLEMKVENLRGQIIAINAETPESEARYLPSDDALFANPDTSIVTAKTVKAESEVFGVLAAMADKGMVAARNRWLAEEKNVGNEFAAVA